MNKAEKVLSFRSGSDESDERTQRSFSGPQIEIGSGNAHPVGTPPRYVRYSLSRMS
jgi:hypothetical protein